LKVKIFLAVTAAAIIFSLAFVGFSLYDHDPIFKEGPPPSFGNEIGTINPETAHQLEFLFNGSGIPSMALGILVGDELVWAKGYGHQPDLSTVYMIGSIDKTMIATSILQLAEQGLLKLDDDINDYLPFPVRHPDYPDLAITIQMLLTHTSGLPHDVPGTGSILGSDGPMVRWELKNHRNFSALYRYLFPPSENKLAGIFSLDSDDQPDFWLSKPGRNYQYSNTAFLLFLNMIIEKVSGLSHVEYIIENIFDSLDMENTSFEAADFPRDQIAVAYEDFGEGGASDLPITGMTASGKIRSNLIDLSKFLLVHMNEGSLGDTQIMTPESTALMHEQHKALTIQDFPPMYLTGVGLGWFLWENGYQGHGGAVPGYYAKMVFNEGEGVPYGIVMLMTYGCSKTPCDLDWFNEYFVGIRELLFEEAKSLASEQVK